MNANEAIRTIESPEFCAYLNVASNYKTFVRAMTSHEAVRALYKAMDDQSVAANVFGQILDLSQSDVSEGLEHPADSAMAAYLWVLTERSPDLSEVAAAVILECKQCWWARKLATAIALRYRSQTDVHFEIHGESGRDVFAYPNEAVFQTQTRVLPRCVRNEFLPMNHRYEILTIGAGASEQDFFRSSGTENRIARLEAYK